MKGNAGLTCAYASKSYGTTSSCGHRSRASLNHMPLEMPWARAYERSGGVCLLLLLVSLRSVDSVARLVGDRGQLATAAR